MKNMVFIFCFILSFSVPLFSDQLAWITKEQAEETVAYFKEKNITDVVLWCACCDGDTKIRITVNDVFYRYTGTENYFQVYIEGYTAGGISINDGIDLAYVHIKKNSKWYCLGKELGFDCDPCTKPFKMSKG